MAEEVITTPETPETPDVESLQAEKAKLAAEVAKLKEAVSTASAQAADYKRKWRDTMGEQERREAEIAEQRASEKALLESLLTEKRVSGYAEKLVAAGYDTATAKVMAAALPDGVSDEYFAAVKSGIDAKVEATKNAMLNTQPTVTGGTTPTAEDANKAELEKLRRAFGL